MTCVLGFCVQPSCNFFIRITTTFVRLIHARIKKRGWGAGGLNTQWKITGAIGSLGISNFPLENLK